MASMKAAGTPAIRKPISATIDCAAAVPTMPMKTLRVVPVTIVSTSALKLPESRSDTRRQRSQTMRSPSR